MKTVKHLLVSSLLGLSLAIGSANAADHMQNQAAKEHNQEGLFVHKPWVRAVPPSSRMSAAYMIIHNNTMDEDHLVRATSNVAETVELHNVRQKEGMMEMYQVKGVGIDAMGQQQLKPGSYHIMLIGLKQPLKVGDEVELTLHFTHAGEVKVKAPVKEGGMMMNKPMQHGPMPH